MSWHGRVAPLVNGSIRFVCGQLYTHFAFAYDAAVHLVSLGEWKEWGRLAIPFIPAGARVLEIAHGPGHLQRDLHERGFRAIGIDRSAQMGALAGRRLTRASPHRLPPLVRADAGRLPFAARSFDCVVCTFPAEFIFAIETLSETHRVLTDGGRMVIVPHAGFLRGNLVSRAIRLTHRLGGGGDAGGAQLAAISGGFARAGFCFEAESRRTRRAEVAVWVCQRRAMPSAEASA